VKSSYALERGDRPPSATELRPGSFETRSRDRVSRESSARPATVESTAGFKHCRAALCRQHGDCATMPTPRWWLILWAIAVAGCETHSRIPDHPVAQCRQSGVGQ
jgi:hypothetical protein